jgi:hypothetical protein
MAQIQFSNEQDALEWAEEYRKAHHKPLATNLFREVALEGEEIATIGKKYPFVTNQAEKVKVCDDEPTYLYMDTPSRFYNESNNTYKYVYKPELHQALKTLALGVYGVSLNRDLRPEDYEDCAEVYQAFKALFLSKYDERLNKLNDKL